MEAYDENKGHYRCYSPNKILASKSNIKVILYAQKPLFGTLFQSPS